MKNSSRIQKNHPEIKNSSELRKIIQKLKTHPEFRTNPEMDLKNHPTRMHMTMSWNLYHYTKRLETSHKALIYHERPNRTIRWSKDWPIHRYIQGRCHGGKLLWASSCGSQRTHSFCLPMGHRVQRIRWCVFLELILWESHANDFV